MDRHEFAKQYQSVFARLWLIAASVIGDRNEADDIVQEAAVIAYRKMDAFQAGTNFGAWAARIVRHCAANHNRKRQGRKTHAVDPSAFDQQPDDSALETSFNSMAQHPGDLQTAFDDDLFRGLAQLSTEARTCLLLRVVDELPYTEIAELLGIPAGTAMSHVHRSKKQLRLSYPNGFDRKAAANE